MKALRWKYTDETDIQSSGLVYWTLNFGGYYLRIDKLDKGFCVWMSNNHWPEWELDGDFNTVAEAKRFALSELENVFTLLHKQYAEDLKILRAALKSKGKKK